MSNRILRVNQVLKEELGKIIAKEIEFPGNVLCTITRAETAPNLQQAKIYVSVVPDKESKKVLEVLQRQIFQIQQLVNQKFVMRPVPKIMFIQEGQTKEAAEVEYLLEEIKEGVSPKLKSQSVKVSRFHRGLSTKSEQLKTKNH